MNLMEKAYKDFNMNEYICEVYVMETNYECSVRRLVPNSHVEEHHWDDKK